MTRRAAHPDPTQAGSAIPGTPVSGWRFVAAEGTVVSGPLLAIGNTTSRVDFDHDPGIWVDEWSATGIGHHWSLSLGHRAGDYAAAASLLGIDFRQV